MKMKFQFPNISIKPYNHVTFLGGGHCIAADRARRGRAGPRMGSPRRRRRWRCRCRSPRGRTPRPPATSSPACTPRTGAAGAGGGCPAGRRGGAMWGVMRGVWINGVALHSGVMRGVSCFDPRRCVVRRCVGACCLVLWRVLFCFAL